MVANSKFIFRAYAMAIIWLAVFVFSNIQSKAQEAPLIQFSGVLVTADSLAGIPYATIIIKTINRGTISNYDGFFSFVAREGDTVQFSSVGYKRVDYVIPTALGDDKYSIIQMMTKDTINLPETIVHPWPTPSQFKDAFLALDIPDDDLERARKNLERERLRELGDAMAYDANENLDFYMRQHAKTFYYNGQYPPLQIFNPLAWAQFIQAWRDGKFKSEKKRKN